MGCVGREMIARCQEPIVELDQVAALLQLQATPPIFTSAQEDWCSWWNKMVLQQLQIWYHEEIIMRNYLMNVQSFWKRFRAPGKRRCLIKRKILWRCNILPKALRNSKKPTAKVAHTALLWSWYAYASPRIFSYMSTSSIKKTEQNYW